MLEFRAFRTNVAAAIPSSKVMENVPNSCNTKVYLKQLAKNILNKMYHTVFYSIYSKYIMWNMYTSLEPNPLVASSDYIRFYHLLLAH